MSSIKVVIDLKMDALNYWQALNHNTHSSAWKDQLEKNDFDFSILVGVSEQQAYDLLQPYLAKVWSNDFMIEAKTKQEAMETRLNQLKDKIFSRMDQLTKNPLYISDFTIFLTSLNRGPYNWTKGYTRSGVYRPNYIKAFIHEILHFQTIYYYKDSMMEVLKDDKKFEDIKEALTFLLNYEFKDVIDGEDKGYPQHQELRKKLETYRINSNKDFDELIKYALSCV